MELSHYWNCSLITVETAVTQLKERHLLLLLLLLLQESYKQPSLFHESILMLHN